MKRINLAFFILLVIATLVLSYMVVASSRVVATQERISGISRVLMHAPGIYSILVEEPNGLVTIRSFTRPCSDVRTNLFRDAPESSSIWAESIRKESIIESCSSLISIHLHSASEINGAGWDAGKYGAGQTVVIH